MPKGIVATCALVTAALAASGCGSRPSAEEQIRTTFQKAASALKAGDGKAFCDQLAPAQRKLIDDAVKGAIGAPDCAAAINELAQASRAANGQAVGASLSRLASSKLTGIKVAGDSAEAQTDPAQADGKPITFSRVNGHWKLNG